MSVAPPMLTRSSAAQQARARALRDSELIEAYHSGRREAFDELVLAYDQQVHRILSDFRVPIAELDDLAQEVFVRVFRNLHRFRDEASFYTWLYRITINVFFDHGKKRNRAEVRLKRLQSAFVDVTNVRPDFADPYIACYDAWTRDEFARAIGTLPEAFRSVVALRVIGDLAYEDIARQTGISVGTVRSRLSRARGRLKDLLGPVLIPTAA